MPDTKGYLDLGASSDGLVGQRTPLYGWFVALPSPRGGDLSLVPIVQLCAYFAAVLFLYASLRRVGMRAEGRLALCLPLFAATPIPLYASAIIPEFPALALLIASIGTETRPTSPPRPATSTS